MQALCQKGASNKKHIKKLLFQRSNHANDTIIYMIFRICFKFVGKSIMYTYKMNNNIQRITIFIMCKIKT